MLHASMRRYAPAVLALSLIVLLPTEAFACACGCAVFDVGTSSLLPSGPGATVFLEYDFLDQTTNWSGSGRAPAANNTDKEIRSNFLVAGGQYMFNSDWGVMAEIPYTDRYFRTSDPGAPGAFDHAAVGDIRLMGVYSGFSADMSTGIVFGVKLPTGDHTYPNFDTDVEIGSGSTDLMIGGYHSGSLTPDRSFGYFTQVLFQHEIATQYAYRPGYEMNGAVGVSYNDIQFGNGLHIAPILQVIASLRGRDGEANGDPSTAATTGFSSRRESRSIAMRGNSTRMWRSRPTITSTAISLPHPWRSNSSRATALTTDLNTFASRSRIRACFFARPPEGRLSHFRRSSRIPAGANLYA